MAATTMVHVRLDGEVKERAAEALAAMGLSISDAVRAFLVRVAAEKQMPFALQVPNAQTMAAMAEADEIVKNHSARFDQGQEMFDALGRKTRRRQTRTPPAGG
ncbi:MAG TPA: type II toxin-antitoxin system RelB/DinJ family antitoxin [Holophaga sp.]|nr:type II toxin-antitoxin system RelB/DinJ family antitoxin [Holophaga sp.]